MVIIWTEEIRLEKGQGFDKESCSEKKKKEKRLLSLLGREGEQLFEAEPDDPARHWEEGPEQSYAMNRASIITRELRMCMGVLNDS